MRKPHVKLMLGDCIDKLKDVNSNSIDAIIADIPYNINYHTWDNFNLCDVIDALNRVLKSFDREIMAVAQAFGGKLDSDFQKRMNDT